MVKFPAVGGLMSDPASRIGLPRLVWLREKFGSVTARGDVAVELMSDLFRVICEPVWSTCGPRHSD